MTKFGFGIGLPPIRISKDDSKYLTKTQVKKVQFLFENDYFIWNEAEMYLRYHEVFTTLPNSDILYDNLCRTTRVVFNLIHDTHFSGTGSNAAHLKYFEVLDAWGSLSEYIKTHNAFPQPFIDWFDTIFQIYQEKEESGEKIIQCDNFLRLYLKAGLTEEDAMRAFTQISAKKKLRLTFDYLIFLLKQIITSNEPENISYLLVPNLQSTLLTDKIEKPPDQVYRNYYDYKQVYYPSSKLKQCDWDKYEQNEQKKKFENKGIINIPTQIKPDLKNVTNNNNSTINNNPQKSSVNSSPVKHEIKVQNHLVPKKPESTSSIPTAPSKIIISNNISNGKSITVINATNNQQSTLTAYYKMNTNSNNNSNNNSIFSSPSPNIQLNSTISSTTSNSQTIASNPSTSTLNTINNSNSITNNSSSVDNIENFYKIKNMPAIHSASNTNSISSSSAKQPTNSEFKSNTTNASIADFSTATNQVLDYFGNKKNDSITNPSLPFASSPAAVDVSKSIKIEVLSESSSTSNYNKNSDSSELFEDMSANKTSFSSHHQQNQYQRQREEKILNLKKDSPIFPFKQNSELIQPRRENQYSKFRSKSELGSRNSSFNSEFKLSEFRREFKPSTMELSQTLSKSINTLEYLGKMSANSTINSISNSLSNKTNENSFLRDKYFLRKNTGSTSINKKKFKTIQSQKDSSIYSDLINTSESESLPNNRSCRNNKLKKLKPINDSLLKNEKPTQMVELKFKNNNKKNTELNWNDLKKEFLIQKLIGTDESEYDDENELDLHQNRSDVRSHHHHGHHHHNRQRHINDGQNSSENQLNDESNDDEDDDGNRNLNLAQENDSDDDSDESIHLYSGSLSEKLKKMSHNSKRQENRENIISKNKIFSSTSISSSCNSLCSNESIKKVYTDHSKKGGIIHQLNNNNNIRNTPHSTASISKIYPAGADELTNKSQPSNIKIKSLPLNHPTSFKLNDDPYLRPQMKKSNNYRCLVIKKPGSNNSSSSTTHLQYISNSKLIKPNESTKEDLGDASSASYLVSSIVHNNNNNNNSANYSLVSSKQLTSRQQQLIKLKKKKTTSNVIVASANSAVIMANASELGVEPEETKSENYAKPAKAKTSERSHGLSEPIKSILDAIVSLSSLDTLNDIDSDDDNEENDEDEDEDNDRNLYLHHNNHHHHHENNNTTVNYSHSLSNNNKNGAKYNKLVEPSDSTIDMNYADHQVYRYDANEYYIGNNNDNSKMLIEQDWSYSLNSNGISSSEHRLISEIIRKLKPIISKCVKKEIKNYLDHHMNSSNHANSFNGASNNNCSIKETIKKNFMTQMDKNSLTNIGDF